MADSQIAVTEGSGKNVDTRTNAAGDHRQVVVVGNPTATDSVAEVQATDPGSNALGLVVRDVNTSAIVSALSTGIALTGVVSTANSSTTPLGSGGVFTGTGEDTKNYALIQVNVVSNQASATDGLSLQQSSDNTNWDITDTFTIPASTGKLFSVQPGARYFRIVYTNGVSAQASFRLQTIFKYTASKGSSQRPGDGYTNETDAEQVQTFNMLLNRLGTWDRARNDSGVALGALRVVQATDVASSMSIVGVNTTNTLGVYVAGTAGTINVFNLSQGTTAISAKDGTFAVYFSPATPNVATLNGAQAIGNSGVVGATTQRVVHATDVAQSMNISAIGTTNTLGVYLSATAGSLAVFLKPGTLAVSLDPGYTIGNLGNVDFVTRVRNIVDGTLTTVTGLDRVRNIVDGTLSTVSRVSNVVDGTLSTVTRVSNVVDGTLTTVSTVAMTQRVNNVVDGTLSLIAMAQRVNNVVDGTIGIVRWGTNNVVQPNAGIPAFNTYATTSIFTVSGTTSTAGNNTLVSPSASYNFKVFAYSIQTTGIVSSAPRFTTGASAGATELWRPVINAVQTTSTPVGANLAVAPPGYLFATGTNTTLALYLDTGSLMHYSVSYIKESA